MAAPKRRSPSTRRSLCPPSTGLDLVGDRWTLLVIRDLLFLNKRTFGELLESPERIASNILTDRLKRLEAAQVVERVPHPEGARRSAYQLTEKGRAFTPVLQELILWGVTHCGETWTPPPAALPKRARPKVAKSKRKPGT